MVSLTVISEPNLFLRNKADFVVFIDLILVSLIDDMFWSMEKNDGIGLAANQVSVLQRIIVVNVPIEDKKLDSYTLHYKKFVLLNPEMIWNNNIKISSQEGCLSVPNISEKIFRFSRVLIRYQNLHGSFIHINSSCMLSFCFQHEIDHINGILFFDRLSYLKKTIIQKKLFKITKKL